MAKSSVKNGGPTRGRKRIRRIGMGSGKHLSAKHNPNVKAKKGSR